MFEDNFQSYFGESDSDFFGDTSNDMIFGEGYGEQCVDGSQFFSEAVGFSSTGGEFINEATAFDMDGDVFTELDSSIPNSSDLRSHGRAEWVAKRMVDTSGAQIEARKKALDKGASPRDIVAAGVEAGKKVRKAREPMLDEELRATSKHSKGMDDADWKYFHDRRDKSKAKADGARPMSTQNSASSGTPIKRTSDDKVVGRSYPAGDKRLDGKSNK